MREGKIDRSPTGTGCSARAAVLIARGLMAWGAVYRARSVIGSEFVCRIARPTTTGGRSGIVPFISGRAWITGVSQYMLDPTDPWPSGYRLAGTRALGRQIERFARSARPLDEKTAMKYPVHDLLWSPQADFNRFARRLA
jgi:hypothetical protein